MKLYWSLDGAYKNPPIMEIVNIKIIRFACFVDVMGFPDDYLVPGKWKINK
jgi:hypothetical protein